MSEPFLVHETVRLSTSIVVQRKEHSLYRHSDRSGGRPHSLYLGVKCLTEHPPAFRSTKRPRYGGWGVPARRLGVPARRLVVPARRLVVPVRRLGVPARRLDTDRQGFLPRPGPTRQIYAVPSRLPSGSTAAACWTRDPQWGANSLQQVENQYKKNIYVTGLQNYALHFLEF